MRSVNPKGRSGLRYEMHELKTFKTHLKKLSNLCGYSVLWKRRTWKKGGDSCVPSINYLHLVA